MSYEDLLASFRVKDLMISEFAPWNISLLPNQVTIGSVIFTPNSADTKLDPFGFVDADTTQLFNAVKFAKAAIGSEFKAHHFSFLGPMLDDPHVVFYLIPRYSDPIEVDDRTYIDADWPNLVQFRHYQVDEATLQAVKNRLKWAFVCGLC